MNASPRALWRHLAWHNVQALGMAVAAGMAAALLWGLLVLVAYWFTLLGATIERGMDAERSMQIFDARDLVGPRFWPGLGIGAAGLLGLALIARRGQWTERMRESRFYLCWAVVELMLIPSNLLLAAWGNLRALVWLSGRERRLAWALLQAVGARDRAGSSLPLTGAAAEIGATGPLVPRLDLALFVLQITGLVSLHEQTGEGWLLSLASPEARALCRRPTEDARTTPPVTPATPTEAGENLPV